MGIDRYWMEDVDRLGEYNWAGAICQFLVDALDETRGKMRMTKNLQINGFTMLLRVWHYYFLRTVVQLVN